MLQAEIGASSPFNLSTGPCGSGPHRPGTGPLPQGGDHGNQPQQTAPDMECESNGKREREREKGIQESGTMTQE